MKTLQLLLAATLIISLTAAAPLQEEDRGEAGTSGDISSVQADPEEVLWFHSLCSVMVIVFSQVLSRQKRFFFSCCGVDLFQVVQDVEDVDDGNEMMIPMLAVLQVQALTMPVLPTNLIFLRLNVKVEEEQKQKQSRTQRRTK